MSFEISGKACADFLFRMGIYFLAALAATVLTIGTFAATSSPTKNYELFAITTNEHKHQGDSVANYSKYVVRSDGTEVFYSDRAECKHPNGDMYLTTPQLDSRYFSGRMFSGFPDDEVPEGFRPQERRLQKSPWYYKWEELDIPPVGSTCRMVASPFTRVFNGLISRRHHDVYGPWFDIPGQD